MTAASTTALITDAATEFGGAMLTILGAVLVIGVGYLVFRKGWKRIKEIASDRSIKVGGYYLRNVPFKGYHRFRSEKWNLEHM